MPLPAINFNDVVRYLFFALLFIFASTSLSYWLFDYSWLEQQRITQLLMIACGALAWLIVQVRSPLPQISLPLLLALGLGLLAAVCAKHPEWALKEWAKYTAMIGALLYLGLLLRDESKQTIVLAVLLLVSVILTVQFFVFYLASFFTGTRDVNPYLMALRI